MQNVASENFRKSLLLSAASFFERRLVSILTELVNQWSHSTLPLNEFVRIKAIERQYHTYFDWDRPNGNPFFRLFGSDFKAFMERRCKDDEAFSDSVEAFIEIGRERNRLVHQDFGSYALEKTFDEIYDLYKKARHFLDNLEQCFTDFNAQPTNEND
ncbi:MAG: hypothetical protein KDA93_22185 [Planctomycetaceae bacterium]|nr:hypothetical protein [Planctomycetaceae bacterium]